MDRKVFVLDTSVFLHDPKAIFNFKNCDIVIPLAVLEELDKLKKRSDEKGENSREVLRFFSLLKKKKDFVDKIQLEGNLFLEIFVDKEKISNKFLFVFDKCIHRILFCAFSLKKEGKNVVFLSKNVLNRIKANALKIPSEDYSGLKVLYEDLKKGIKKIELSKKKIDIFQKDGFLELKDFEFIANEYFLLTSKENTSFLCRHDEEKKSIERIFSLKEKIWGILPLNTAQRCSLDLLLKDDIPLVALIGPAGTGKTLLALASALKKVFDEAEYRKILITRPVIPLGKDIGYLPGTKEEKLYHWMRPIYDNLEFLCEKKMGKEHVDSTLEHVVQSKKIEMEAVSYIRGRSLPNAYMIIDEAQNLTPHEIKTIISRAGKKTKVILTGDPTQIDNPYLDKDSNGLSFVLSKFRKERLFGYVFLDKTERSKLSELSIKIL